VRAQRRTQNEVGLENALPQKSDDETPIWQCWKQCIMINMHVHVPEKYRSPFLHGVFLFSKVEVLVVNFDDFFALAYSSHILWSWPLGKIWCHHTSLSSTLDLKSCQFCPIFLERESWSQPYQIFFIAPQLDHAPKCSIRVWVWGYMKEGLTRSFFFSPHAEIWNSKAIPDT